MNIICNTYNYKIWIHTIILVHIPMYTYNYMSKYTFIDIIYNYTISIFSFFITSLFSFIVNSVFFSNDMLYLSGKLSM